MSGKFNNTGIDFDEWSQAPYNHGEVDRELQIQKKRQYPEDHKPPFPKPVIQRIPLKPMRTVSFLQEPVIHEPETLAMQQLTQALQQAGIGAGTDWSIVWIRGDATAKEIFYKIAMVLNRGC